MAIVAGVDFGTLSVRVTLLDSERGRLGTASAEYPLHRKQEDPDFATQSHEDQMRRAGGGGARGGAADGSGREGDRGAGAGYDGVECDSGGRAAAAAG